MSEVDQAVVEELVGNAHGNLARVRELLDAHPAALNMRAPWNETAVEAATQMGNRPILGAVMGGSVDMVRLLLERGADASLPEYEGRGARRLAEDMGRADIAELFD
jgi:hypothetical protein